jgi:hypothetical protein
MVENHCWTKVQAFLYAKLPVTASVFSHLADCLALWNELKVNTILPAE